MPFTPVFSSPSSILTYHWSTISGSCPYGLWSLWPSLNHLFKPQMRLCSLLSQDISAPEPKDKVQALVKIPRRKFPKAWILSTLRVTLHSPWCVHPAPTTPRCSQSCTRDMGSMSLGLISTIPHAQSSFKPFRTTSSKQPPLHTQVLYVLLYHCTWMVSCLQLSFPNQILSHQGQESVSIHLFIHYSTNI